MNINLSLTLTSFSISSLHTEAIKISFFEKLSASSTSAKIIDRLTQATQNYVCIIFSHVKDFQISSDNKMDQSNPVFASIYKDSSSEITKSI